MNAPSPISNPYAPPSAFASPPMAADDNRITPGMLDALRRTQPWVMFLAVLTFIFAGFSALAAIVMSIVPNQPQNPMPMSLLALFYVVFAVAYAFFGWKLVGYSSALGNASVRGDSASVEAALDRNRGIWFTSGMFAIGGILLVIVFGVVIGVMAASRPVGTRPAPTYSSMVR